MQEIETEPAHVDGCAFAADKAAWKDAGNRFTAEELRAMEQHGGDIVIFEASEPVYCAD